MVQIAVVIEGEIVAVTAEDAVAVPAEAAAAVVVVVAADMAAAMVGTAVMVATVVAVDVARTTNHHRDTHSTPSLRSVAQGRLDIEKV